MYEQTSAVGERGQITIPKEIREKEGIKKHDKVLVIDKGGIIVIQKVQSKGHIERLLKERYQKYAKLDEETNREWEHSSKEANRNL